MIKKRARGANKWQRKHFVNESSQPPDRESENMLGGGKGGQPKPEKRECEAPATAHIQGGGEECADKGSDKGRRE